MRSSSSTAWHFPTAIALGAFAWILLMMGHEVLGHGAACVALGGEALAVDAMYFTCSPLEPGWRDQLYRAGGSLFNVLLAVASLWGLGRLARPRSWLGYFLWITAILDLLQSGSYIAFGQFIHPGMDWAMIAAAAPAGPPWSGISLAAGLGLIILGLLVGHRYEPLFLTGSAVLGRQKTRLLLTPYLSASAVSIAASLLVPSDDRVMMLMGGIGNSLFFLAPMLLLLAWPVRWSELLEGRPDLTAKPAVVVAGAVATLIYVFVLSGGLDLS